MTSPSCELRKKLEGLLETWRRERLPTRCQLTSTFKNLIEWRVASKPCALWMSPPLMLTATLDDGWGHGLELIELCAEAAGLRVIPLGLLQTPEKIVSACHGHYPEILGLTMLQFDSEPHLTYILENLPPKTQLIVGGPVFRIDPELVSRTGVHFFARDVADFLELLLKLSA